MEGQNISNPDFWNLLKGAFSILFKKIHVVLAVVIASGVVSLLLMYGTQYLPVPEFAFSGLMGPLIATILINIGYGVFSVLIGMIFGLAMIKLFVSAVKGEEVGFEVFDYGVKNVWGAFKVTVRVFFYVLFWPLLIFTLILIAFAVLNAVMVSGLGVPAFGGAFGTAAPDAVTLSQGSSLTGTIGNGAKFVLSALGFVTLIIMLYFALVRGLRAMFSLYAYVEKGKRGKDALEYSKDLVKGVWWMIFWRLFFFGVLTLLVMLAVALIGSLVTGGAFEFAVGSGQISLDESLLANVFNQSVSGVLGAVVVAFVSQLFIKLKVFKGI